MEDSGILAVTNREGKRVGAKPPVFGDLLKQSQMALAGLQALEEQLSTRLADQHGKLKQTRAELEQANHELASLGTAHDRLTAEHAKTADEAAHLRQVRTELEGRVTQLHQELDQTARGRDELLMAQEKERVDLHKRLARNEASLADSVTRVEALEAQLDEFNGAQL